MFALALFTVDFLWLVPPDFAAVEANEFFSWSVAMLFVWIRPVPRSLPNVFLHFFEVVSLVLSVALWSLKASEPGVAGDCVRSRGA